jgi:mannose-6-phosphate isomerase
MDDVPLYPLRFHPIYKSALWGGRRLEDLLSAELPSGEPVGEAWVLSDQGSHLSRVVDGPLAGRSLRELMNGNAARIVGQHAARHHRFPLLLKFIDAQQPLSVQVHPHDRHTDLVPPGEQGKTEAWVVLHADPGSRIYAGLRQGVGPDDLRQAVAEQTLEDCLHWFTPRAGDCVFIPAGTVHALGAGVVIFEVQQTSDITFRLHDWNRVDARTRRPRELHIEQSFACTDFGGGPRLPAVPVLEATAPVRRERLTACEYFHLWRLQGEQPFTAGKEGACRILVCIEGRAEVRHDGEIYPIGKGDVLLLPAEVGACACRPLGGAMLLECGLTA